LIKKLGKKIESSQINEFLNSNSSINLNLSIFRNTELTIFEALVKHLKEDCSYSFKEISLLLDKDQRNIWTIYNRAKKK
jgi:hypothetical protein